MLSVIQKDFDNSRGNVVLADLPMECAATDEATPYSYCLIRTDIPLEAQLVQACHSCLQHQAPDDINHLILLSVQDEAALLREEQRLISCGLNPTLFFEPDNDMGYTSLAIGPLYGKERRLMRRMQLWRPPQPTAGH